ncbi:universal stress protein [Methanothrix harundinacea]|jgi:nucleotide-binding universal stress UspA family protein|uniref:Universal stress protein n=1 Tax=Methanothrix harundinacea (strain 6Ac) TaxID=1110509 RepID=G7WQH6_METH6|nr:universal stress protein [Methanothrix harundinacea]AET65529.1 Universal stress protein [Methanothrix harundinacea 6Ac]
MNDRILVATDGSAAAMVAVKKGVDLAKATGAEVLGVYVVDELAVANAVRLFGADKEDLERKLQAGGEEAVSDLRRIAEEAGVPVETVVTFGVPANSIIELAKEKGVDMIVMGGHGQSGVTKFIIGSVVKNVLYRATVPVLVVR